MKEIFKSHKLLPTVELFYFTTKQNPQKTKTRFKSFSYRAKCHQFCKNKGEKSHDKIEYKIFSTFILY